MRYDPDAALNEAIAEINDLRARLAEVEAERDRRTSASYWPGLTAENADLRARLAAVQAVFGERDCPNGYEVNEPGCACYVCKVRAAARGEGDR